MTQAPSPTERTALLRLILILEEFRKVNPEMAIQQALTLLTAASEPGLTVTDLAKKAGLGLASTSRHVEVLGPHRPAKNIGLGLLSDDFHDTDRRRKIIRLTPAGQRTVKSLIDLINR